MASSSWLKESGSSCWSTLGVATDATEVDIRAAYKTLAFQQHPDKFDVAHRAEATAQFQRLQAAYETCMEAVKNTKRANVVDAEVDPVHPWDSGPQAPRQPEPEPQPQWTPHPEPPRTREPCNSAHESQRIIDELADLENIRDEFESVSGSVKRTSLSAEKRLAMYRSQTEALKERDTPLQRHRSKEAWNKRANFWKRIEEESAAEATEKAARKQEHDDAESGKPKRGWWSWSWLTD